MAKTYMLMKLMIVQVILFSTIHTNAQNILIPKRNVVEKKWLVNTNYQMLWYAVKDKARFETGKTNTSINIRNGKIIVATSISIKQAKTPWIDSTIANAKDLSPVYHSSYNAQRNMVLKFGAIVKGFYNDKTNNSNTVINDTTTQGYFDSNLYPTLITWLPLHEGYKQDISIYDYKPGSKTGVIRATVEDVKKGTFKTKRNGIRNVWIVTVSDEIGGTGNGISTYFIDVADRRLWKQQIKAGSRTMEMELVEL